MQNVHMQLSTLYHDHQCQVQAIVVVVVVVVDFLKFFFPLVEKKTMYKIRHQTHKHVEYEF